MSPFRTPKQRLPDHLKHLSKGPADRTGTGSATERHNRAPHQGLTEPPATSGSDRLGELLPVVLRAMVGDLTELSSEGRPVVLSQGEVLAALDPYHRPRSRFEGLMVRKLVGDGYLKPRGARDKSGLSDAYELTPRGEKLLGLHRSL